MNMAELPLSQENRLMEAAQLATVEAIASNENTSELKEETQDDKNLLLDTITGTATSPAAGKTRRATKPTSTDVHLALESKCSSTSDMSMTSQCSCTDDDVTLQKVAKVQVQEEQEEEEQSTTTMETVSGDHNEGTTMMETLFSKDDELEEPKAKDSEESANKEETVVVEKEEAQVDATPLVLEETVSVDNTKQDDTALDTAVVVSEEAAAFNVPSASLEHVAPECPTIDALSIELGVESNAKWTKDDEATLQDAISEVEAEVEEATTTPTTTDPSAALQKDSSDNNMPGTMDKDVPAPEPAPTMEDSIEMSLVDAKVAEASSMPAFDHFQEEKKEEEDLVVPFAENEVQGTPVAHEEDIEEKEKLEVSIVAEQEDQAMADGDNKATETTSMPMVEENKEEETVSVKAKDEEVEAQFILMADEKETVAAENKEQENTPIVDEVELTEEPVTTVADERNDVVDEKEVEAEAATVTKDEPTEESVAAAVVETTPSDVVVKDNADATIATDDQPTEEAVATVVKEKTLSDDVKDEAAIDEPTEEPVTTAVQEKASSDFVEGEVAASSSDLSSGSIASDRQRKILDTLKNALAVEEARSMTVKSPHPEIESKVSGEDVFEIASRLAEEATADVQKNSSSQSDSLAVEQQASWGERYRNGLIPGLSLETETATFQGVKKKVAAINQRLSVTGPGIVRPTNTLETSKSQASSTSSKPTVADTNEPQLDSATVDTSKPEASTLESKATMTGPNDSATVDTSKSEASTTEPKPTVTGTNDSATVVASKSEASTTEPKPTVTGTNTSQLDSILVASISTSMEDKRKRRASTGEMVIVRCKTVGESPTSANRKNLLEKYNKELYSSNEMNDLINIDPADELADPIDFEALRKIIKECPSTCRLKYALTFNGEKHLVYPLFSLVANGAPADLIRAMFFENPFRILGERDKHGRTVMHYACAYKPLSAQAFTFLIHRSSNSLDVVCTQPVRTRRWKPTLSYCF